MKLFDSHCHLDDRSYRKDFDSVLERAASAGVKKIMLVGITEKNSMKIVEMAENNPVFCTSVGIHPHDASSCSAEAIDRLKKVAENPVVCAWGETGLDFNRMYSPKEIQEKWFSKQVEAALDLGLPLIFHERDSGGRFLEMLRHIDQSGSSLRGVVHCFSGSLDEMKAYVDLGLYIGVTGILTIQTRGADLREIVKHIPSERLLIETDAPYLTPAPQKNKTRRNEPAFVSSTLFKLAEVRGENPEELAGKIWENTCALYNISDCQ